MTWDDLSMAQKAKYIQLGVSNGITDLSVIRDVFDKHISDPDYIESLAQDLSGQGITPLVNDVNKRSNADFVKRLQDPYRQTIPDWENPNTHVATHKMSYDRYRDSDTLETVYPKVQNINGQLIDFTDPRNGYGEWDALEKAVERGDTLMMTPEQAEVFSKYYKREYPTFNRYDDGSKMKTPRNHGPETYYAPAVSTSTRGVIDSSNPPKKLSDVPNIYDPETDAWLTNWLTQRKGILQKNIKQTPESELFWPYVYESGKLDAEQVAKKENKENVDNILKAELSSSRLATEVPWEIPLMMGEDNEHTLGARFGLNNNRTQHVSYNYTNPNFTNKKSARVHERAHALMASPQESAIQQIMNLSKNRSTFEPLSDYIAQPTEVYSRLMQFRYENDLKPDQVIDQKYLDNNRESIKKHWLDIFDDETLLKLFNDVAQNEVPVDNDFAPNYTSLGGNLRRRFDNGGDKNVLSTIWDWFSNATLGAMIADNPAVATASGWRYNKDGKVVQDKQDDPGVTQLRENLADLSMLAYGADVEPLVTGAWTLGKAAAKAAAHPVQTGRAIVGLGEKAADLGKYGYEWLQDFWKVGKHQGVQRALNTQKLSRELNNSLNGRLLYEGEVFPNNTIQLESWPVSSEKGGKHVFNQRTSKLTDAERAGIPKGERHQPANPPLQNFGELEYTDKGIIAPQLGTPLGSGSEALVFDAGENVYKVVNTPWINMAESSVAPEFTVDDIGWFVKNFINKRNQHPIFEPMKFEGVISNHGRLSPVVSQRKLRPVMSGEEAMSVENQLQEALQRYGYTEAAGSRAGYRGFRNNIGTISDLDFVNLGYTPDGQLRAFDILAYKKGGKLKHIK